MATIPKDAARTAWFYCGPEACTIVPTERSPWSRDADVTGDPTCLSVLISPLECNPLVGLPWSSVPRYSIPFLAHLQYSKGLRYDKFSARSAPKGVVPY